MPRKARVVIENAPHHVTQRGNNKQDVFFTDDDRRKYLALLKDKADTYGLSILAYCLMTNHVHLVVIPRSAEALAKAIGRTNFLYTQYINRLHNRTGHLWQNRFFSGALDETHTWRAISYVERNPLRARMVRLPWRYQWSSAAAHAGLQDDSQLLDLNFWRKYWQPAKWKREIARPQDDATIEQIRKSLHNGRPLGSDRWITRLEAKLNRRLRPLPIGRPKKTDNTKPKRTRQKRRTKPT